MSFTKVTYIYRDASNYKFWGEFFVSGTFTLAMVEEYLFDGEFFVPHEVGLEHLLDMPINQDDHYLHTFQTFEVVENVEVSKVKCSASELVVQFLEANRLGWFSSF